MNKHSNDELEKLHDSELFKLLHDSLSLVEQLLHEAERRRAGIRCTEVD
jgi:hypothetical protein